MQCLCCCTHVGSANMLQELHSTTHLRLVSKWQRLNLLIMARSIVGNCSGTSGSLTSTSVQYIVYYVVGRSGHSPLPPGPTTHASIQTWHCIAHLLTTIHSSIATLHTISGCIMPHHCHIGGGHSRRASAFLLLHFCCPLHIQIVMQMRIAVSNLIKACIASTPRVNYCKWLLIAPIRNSCTQYSSAL